MSCQMKDEWKRKIISKRIITKCFLCSNSCLFSPHHYTLCISWSRFLITGSVNFSNTTKMNTHSRTFSSGINNMSNISQVECFSFLGRFTSKRKWYTMKATLLWKKKSQSYQVSATHSVLSLEFRILLRVYLQPKRHQRQPVSGFRSTRTLSQLLSMPMVG